MSQAGHKAGDVAGCLQPEGYRTINVCKCYVHEHRLAFFIVTGEWPIGTVDHTNHARADNRWKNLRVITHSQNIQRSPKTWGTTGHRGVVRLGTNLYAARIRLFGKNKHLGVFNTASDAGAAYKAVRAKVLSSIGG